MTTEPQHEPVRSRNETFAERTATRIWHEEPSADNPYIAVAAQCHGYDLLELMDKRSFVDVFYLLFRGELPNADEARLLQTLMIALINPGPRHPATRAAMNVGIGKTDPLHILPIGSAVLGGEHMGGGCVESAMRFLRKQQGGDPQLLLQALVQEQLLASTAPDPTQTATHLVANKVPGFGAYYGGVDTLASAIAERLVQLPAAGRALRWGCQLNQLLQPHGVGWLNAGVAAAVFADLGFQPRAGGALLQLLGAPGLVAHGLELANKPITAMPFVSDENYVIEPR